MIYIKQAYKSFGTYDALKAINLTINEGEIHGIVGASGAGKSTLLRLMNKLEQPDRGEVEVAGQALHNLNGLALTRARQAIGMIFQHFNLLSNKTVFKNVELALQLVKMPSKERKGRVLECLSFVGLDHLANKYPAQLSGGQKQRVAIARALANRPKVLLCDEPTSSLDAGTTAEILNVLKMVNEKLGITIVIVSHQLDVIKSICQRVTVLDAGEIYETFSNQASGVKRTATSALDIVNLLKRGEL